MMTNKELYREFCKKNNQLPIFMMETYLPVTKVECYMKWETMRLNLEMYLRIHMMI